MKKESNETFFIVEAWKNYIATNIINAIEKADLYSAQVNFEDWVRAAARMSVPQVIFTEFIAYLVNNPEYLKVLETKLEPVDPINYRDLIIDWLDELDSHIKR